MKMIRGTLKLTLILYICAALSGVYVLSASARITPHPDEDGTVLITIEKGDTLWDLCQTYLEDPTRWPELKEYNDFTNPHLIYPGEQLRIPSDLLSDALQDAEDEVTADQEEIERLTSELAEADAERERLGTRVTELTDELTRTRQNIEELQDSLRSQEELLSSVEEAGETFASGVNQTVQDTREALLQEIAHLDEHFAELSEMLKEHKMKAEATHALVESIQGDVKTLLAQVEANQMAINEAKKILEDAKGIHEEPSTSKRALVFLTTVAAGIGWFAINAIGGRSGE